MKDVYSSCDGCISERKYFRCMCFLVSIDCVPSSCMCEFFVCLLRTHIIFLTGLQYDACGVCGGNNSTCQLTTGAIRTTSMLTTRTLTTSIATTTQTAQTSTMQVSPTTGISATQLIITTASSTTQASTTLANVRSCVMCVESV